MVQDILTGFAKGLCISQGFSSIRQKSALSRQSEPIDGRHGSVSFLGLRIRCAKNGKRPVTPQQVVLADVLVESGDVGKPLSGMAELVLTHSRKALASPCPVSVDAEGRVHLRVPPKGNSAFYRLVHKCEEE